MTDHLT